MVYAYDTAGRLKTVTNPDGSHTYGYLANSNLRETLTSPVHTATTGYEPYRNVVSSVKNEAGMTIISNYGYTVNSLGQRTQRVNTGTAFGTASTDNFTYNAKGEVTASTNATIPAYDRGYTYDDIGNRVGSLLAGASTSYTTNNLNQYTAIGAASPTYDLDGNQRTTGTGQVYEWDAENRLIMVEPVLPLTGDKRQVNTYDSQSRRVRKQVYTYAGSAWGLTTDEKFIYDGWNVVAKLLWNPSTSIFEVKSTYTWGLDWSGSMQGAGGVGGLLTVNDVGEIYYYTYDASGNVSELLNDSGDVAAHYEYDAFGNTVASSGSYASANAYRFSTKPLDAVGNLYYYGYRYYGPTFGRWLARDPIGEAGAGLYTFVRNDPVSRGDLFGLYEFTIPFLDIDTGEVSLGLVWFKIKVTGEWKITVEPGVTADNCPTKVPSNISADFGIDTFTNGIGLDAHIGAVGDNFTAIFGVRFGATTSGDNLLEQLVNLRTEKGSYQDVSMDLQKHIPSFSYASYSTPCACVSAHLEVTSEVSSGVYGVRALVVALIAGAILEPTPAGEAVLGGAAASLAVMPPFFNE